MATVEARELAAQLASWHDAMVKHLRRVAQQGGPCPDGCPHEQARSLWAEALDILGDAAAKLSFLRTHGASSSGRLAQSAEPDGFSGQAGRRPEQHAEAMARYSARQA